MTRLAALVVAATVLSLMGCWSSRIPESAEPYAPGAVEDIEGLRVYLAAAGVDLRYADRDSTDFYRNPIRRRLPRRAAADSLTRVVRVDLLDFAGPGNCLVYTYDVEKKGSGRNRRPAAYLYRTVYQGPNIGGVRETFYFGRLEAVCRGLSVEEENALRGLQGYAPPWRTGAPTRSPS